MRRVRIEGCIAERIVISGSKAHHLTRVLRCNAGDVIHVAGADGRCARTIVESCGADGLILALQEIEESGCEPVRRVSLAVALLKSDKLEWVLQKAVELGVYEIGLYQADNSVVKLENGLNASRIKRYEKIMSEAAEQCGRAKIPRLIICESLVSLLGEFDGPSQFLALHEQQRHCSLRNERTLDENINLVLIIGPEGGLSEREASCQGVRTVSFGARVLRAETAAIAALAVVQALNGDLD